MVNRRVFAAVATEDYGPVSVLFGLEIIFIYNPPLVFDGVRYFFIIFVRHKLFM